ISMNGKFANNIKPYLTKLGRIPLTDDQTFINLLKTSAREDNVMCKCQDDFFELYYFQPAFVWFDGFGFKEPLSLLVIYDSFIHSGSILNFLRQKFGERPPVNGGNEKIWIEEYIMARHNWLANHSNQILQKTIYRTNCFKEQIKNNNWSLEKPVNANGTNVL
ncbi:MAG: peptidoglycan-binding protein, partial [Ignavibacteriales bacterium]